MNKFILAIMMVLCFSTGALAEYHTISYEVNNVDRYTHVITESVCIDGYAYVKVVATTSQRSVSVSIVQSFELFGGKSIPRKCKEK